MIVMKARGSHGCDSDSDSFSPSASREAHLSFNIISYIHFQSNQNYFLNLMLPNLLN